jgi:hypothetical protein
MLHVIYLSKFGRGRSTDARVQGTINPERAAPFLSNLSILGGNKQGYIESSIDDLIRGSSI